MSFRSGGFKKGNPRQTALRILPTYRHLSSVYSKICETQSISESYEPITSTPFMYGTSAEGTRTDASSFW
jgi:hypothetical protein